MRELFLFSSAVKRSPEIDDWFNQNPGDLGSVARRWFDVLRACGDDVREVLHDKHPTACIGQAAFAYVNAFSAHVNVGFFQGAELEDPDRLLEGTGKFMRHVKLRPGEPIDEAALERLIRAAYLDLQHRLERESTDTSGPAG